METTIDNTRRTQVISPSDFLAHWQGHRSLTRRLIEAFPEESLFTHRLGGMRPFSEMVSELLAIAGPGIREIATGEQAKFKEEADYGKSKQKLLDNWDHATEEINKYWKDIALERFHQPIKIFGQYDGTVISSILYFIDNEIHHRGQAYVYLRSLGIEPPAFYDR